MKSDITKFIAIRNSLLQERSQIEARLAQINRALGAGAPAATVAVSSAAAPTGRTNRSGSSGSTGACSLSTQASVSSWGVQTLTAAAGGRNGAFVIEVLDGSLSNILTMNPLQPAGGSNAPLRTK